MVHDDWVWTKRREDAVIRVFVRVNVWSEVAARRFPASDVMVPDIVEMATAAAATVPEPDSKP